MNLCGEIDNEVCVKLDLGESTEKYSMAREKKKKIATRHSAMSRMKAVLVFIQQANPMSKLGIVNQTKIPTCDWCEEETRHYDEMNIVTLYRDTGIILVQTPTKKFKEIRMHTLSEETVSPIGSAKCKEKG